VSHAIGKKYAASVIYYKNSFSHVQKDVVQKVALMSQAGEKSGVLYPDPYLMP